MSDHYCIENQLTTPGDAPISDWSSFPSWPRLSNQVSVRKLSSDPHGWTPITLHTWVGLRWARHTQQTKAESLSLWNGLCNSCDGTHTAATCASSVPGLSCPLRWRGGAGSGFSARLKAGISRRYLYAVFKQRCFHVNVFNLPSGGMRSVCSALKMGLFLHAAGSMPPTESAAERVRMSRQKQGFPFTHGVLT